MKADKILFGAACLGMAYLCNMATNKPDNAEPLLPQKTSAQPLTMKQNLPADTVSFSKYAKNDSLKLAQDTLKTIKKAIK